MAVALVNLCVDVVIVVCDLVCVCACCGSVD